MYFVATCQYAGWQSNNQQAAVCIPSTVAGNCIHAYLQLHLFAVCMLVCFVSVQLLFQICVAYIYMYSCLHYNSYVEYISCLSELARKE